MKIRLNNREEHVDGREQMTVQELLDHKNFTFKFLVVKINGVAVKPGDYAHTMIHDGDEVLVLHLISGG